MGEVCKNELEGVLSRGKLKGCLGLAKTEMLKGITCDKGGIHRGKGAGVNQEMVVPGVWDRVAVLADNPCRAYAHAPKAENNIDLLANNGAIIKGGDIDFGTCRGRLAGQSRIFFGSANERGEGEWKKEGEAFFHSW